MHYNENTYTARVTNESSDRRRVRIFWGKDLGDQLAAFRDGKDVKAVFTKVSSAVYEVRINHDEEVGEEEMPVSTKEAMKQIKEYIAAKGFSYKDELIENFFLSLKSKPFVILAGTSGTGKTRLVRLFAEAIGGRVITSIYKGSYYQCIIRTDMGYDFFVDTDDDWLKDDRVGITVAPEKIIIEKDEEVVEANEN